MDILVLGSEDWAFMQHERIASVVSVLFESEDFRNGSKAWSYPKSSPLTRSN